MTTATPTAQLSLAARRQLDVFRRFVDGLDVHRAPANLRRPHSMSQWSRLPRAERLAHAEQRSRELTAPKVAPVPSASAASAPASRPAPRPSSGYFVPCAICGELRPAKGPRPTSGRCHRAACRYPVAK